jgi:hypothetical protein
LSRRGFRLRPEEVGPGAIELAQRRLGRQDRQLLTVPPQETQPVELGERAADLEADLEPESLREPSLD